MLTGPSAIGAVSAEPSAQETRARAAAQDFEALFLGQMANEMLRSATPQTAQGGFGEEMFRSLLGDEIGRQMSRAGGIGLADEVFKALMERGTE